MPEFTGGGAPESIASPWRGLILPAIGVVAIIAVIAGAVLTAGTWRPLLIKQAPTSNHTQTANGQPEPPSASRFTEALYRHDTVGMRAEITPECIADNNSSLCFDQASDARFISQAKTLTLVSTYIETYSETTHPYKIVLYRLQVIDYTAHTDIEYVLTLILRSDGKIVRCFLEGVTPV